MIKLFKGIKKNLNSIATSASRLASEIDLREARDHHVQDLLGEISGKLDKIVQQFESMSKYFDYEVKQMKELEEQKLTPSGKHDNDF